MKKIFLNGLVFGTAFCISIVLFYFLAKARTGTTATPGDKLTAAKRNELTTTVNSLQTQMTSLTGANWQAFSYSAGWSDFANLGYLPTGYYKDALGIVHLRGLTHNSGTANVTVIFTLPAGYRPSKTLLFTTLANEALARIDIASNGNVIFCRGANGAERVSLDNISFKAEQ